MWGRGKGRLQAIALSTLGEGPGREGGRALEAEGRALEAEETAGTEAQRWESGMG